MIPEARAETLQRVSASDVLVDCAVSLLPFVSNSNVLWICFYQYWWNPCPFEVNDNSSVDLIKSVGSQVCTECVGFPQTVSGSALHVKKQELHGLDAASFCFTAVSPRSMKVHCVVYEFSGSFSVSKKGALAGFSFCLL